MKYVELIREGKGILEEAGRADASFECSLLLAWATGLGRDELFLRLGEEAGFDQARRFLRAVRRRSAGEPLQYITGRQEFMGVTFLVDPRVLIPRQDSEVLVEEVLRRVGGRSLYGLDVGTGSGALAVSLLYHSPGLRMKAVDICPGALEVARANAHLAGVAGRVEFALSDLYPEGRYDFIVCNPPYISEEEYRDLDPQVRDHEPRTALLAGPRGTEFYGPLAEGAGEHLLPGGFISLEIGWKQGDEVSALLRESGFDGVRVLPDLAGRPRVVFAEWKG